MRKKKANPITSKLLFPADANFPRTHFFYEYEDERAVDPAVLVENGILLWHEQIHTNVLDDVSPLWAIAEAELDKRGQAYTNSDLEWLRMQVIINGLTPDFWNKLDPYPYKGLLISALYLQEARRLCRDGDTGRVWHIIALAYYNLGLNTVQSPSQAMALYAIKGRSEDTALKRAIVLEVLKRLEDDPKITDVSKAKRAVINFIQDYKNKKNEYVLLDKLRELDAEITEDTLTEEARCEADNRATSRLERALNSWASLKGPYPEMAEAFAVFDRKKAALASPDATEPAPGRTTGEAIEFETGYHTRIVNVLTNGKTLSLRMEHVEDP